MKVRDQQKRTNKKVVLTMLVTVNAWVLIILMAGILGGCEQQYDDYMAVRFQAFNEAVQDGLADCQADPNACRPTLELMAAELDVWVDVIADPNG